MTSVNETFEGTQTNPRRSIFFSSKSSHRSETAMNHLGYGHEESTRGVAKSADKFPEIGGGGRRKRQ